MTPNEAARALERMARDLTRNVQDAERMSLLDLRDEAERFSGGPLQARDLARMDHPYARRHGSPRLNPDLVNQQDAGEDTGRFAASWVAEGPEVDGDELVSSLFNVDPKAAEFLEDGTDTMFPRRPHEAALEVVAPRREERLERAVDRTLG